MIKVKLLVLLPFFLNALVFAQDYQKDVISTNGGDLEITFLIHASLMMQYDNQIIYIDPTARFGTDFSEMPDADLILITHEHGDHLDPDAISQIRTDNTSIILTSRCFESLGFGDIMANGDHKVFSGIEIDAVPAYNLTMDNHPKGVGNGYVLRFGDKKVYVAGDTENIPEMSNLQDIDVAFLPMNRPTMTAEQVAEAAGRFRPGILYLYHYSGSNTDELVELLANEKDIEVRIRQMYPDE